TVCKGEIIASVTSASHHGADLNSCQNWVNGNSMVALASLHMYGGYSDQQIDVDQVRALIHELTHIPGISLMHRMVQAENGKEYADYGSWDHMYYRQQCLAYARTNPNQAIENADSLSFFIATMARFRF